MVEQGEYQQNDHENQRTDGGIDREEANETDFGEVNTCKELLKSTGVYQPLGVNLAVGHKEYIVSVCEVEKG